MQDVWKCQECGKLHYSEAEMKGCTHGRPTMTCPTCKGLGYIPGKILEPNMKCPNCNGTKKLPLC